MENQEYIEKWLNGTLSEEEQRIFEKTDDYQALVRLSETVQDFTAPEFDVSSEYKRLQQSIAVSPKAKQISMPLRTIFLRIAAVLVVLMGGYFFFLYNPETAVNTVATQTAEVVLPDASAVTLNTASKLTYQQKDWAEQRHVSLEGEAFFRVAKGSRFDVETTAGTITVLGTQFNVKVRGDYFEVICYEGSVRVDSPLQAVTLQPGRMFRVIKGRVIPDATSTNETSPSWLAKESAFESVPFEEVLREVERQYDVTITTQHVNLEQLFTGRFVHHNISLALKSISIPLDLTYEIDEAQKTVVLSGEDN